MIAMLASMKYIVNLDAYEWHPRDEKILNNFMMNTRVLHFTNDRVDCFAKIYLYIYDNACV